MFQCVGAGDILEEGLTSSIAVQPPQSLRWAPEMMTELPRGYLVTFGGQFEEAARSVRSLALLGILILVAMCDVRCAVR